MKQSHRPLLEFVRDWRNPITRFWINKKEVSHEEFVKFLEDKCKKEEEENINER